MSYLDDLKHDLADKAYREAYLEAVRADNDCNDQTMILAYRDVVAALEAQLAATEARECRTREALTAIRMLDPSNHHERRTTFENAWNIADAALAASGPCPHAAEVERLTATNHEIAGTLTEIVIERNALREQLAQAESAACGMAAALQAPAGWRFNVLVDKHSTGAPLPGEIFMLDISRQQVWGHPGQWRYSDGPNKPDVDWMCEAEPLYFAPAALSTVVPCSHAAELAAAQRLCGEAAPHIGRIGHGPNSPTSREYDDLAARLRAAEGRES